MDKENLIIIGGGPAGLSAAIYAARAGLKPLVIEGTVPGGQLTLTSEVENFPGFAQGIMGPELIKAMRSQAERFKTRFISENVVSLNSKLCRYKIEHPRLLPGQNSNIKSSLNVKTKNKQYQTRALLIATGAEAIWLGLEAEQRLRGKGVSACATCDGFFFKDKIVAVIGGGDSALEEALFLTKFARKVYLIHRRDTFRASKIMQERVFNHKNIEVIWNAQVQEILGKEKVEGIQLKIENLLALRSLGEVGKIENLALQGVFVAIGHKPATAFLTGSGVKLDAKGYIVTSARAAHELVKSQLLNAKLTNIENYQKMFESWGEAIVNYQSATSVKGIFAAGDCLDHVYKQAGTAVGMGIAAELEIERYLEESEHPRGLNQHPRGKPA